MARYQDAIEYAYDNYSAFHELHERITAKYDAGHGGDHLTELMERDEQRLAAATCAQTEMIQFLFGKSCEEVETTLRHMYETRLH